MDLTLSGQTSIFGGVCFIFKSLLGIERQKKLKKKFIFDPKASEPSQNIDIHCIECGQTRSHVCTRHFFCSQVFKTSDVLNSVENIVKSFASGTEGFSRSTHGSHILFTLPISMLGADDPCLR